MSTENNHIAQAERQLSPDERERLKEDENRWNDLKGGKHLNDWLGFAPSLLLLRQTAMHLVHTNRPTGRLYSEAFGALVKRHFPGMEDKIVSRILWLHDEPSRMQILREQMAAMTPGELSRFNTPSAACDRVRKALKERDSAHMGRIGVEVEKRPSPVKVRDKIIHALNEENAALKARVERDTGGSLFDLKADTASDIATSILANVSESKAASIADAIKRAIKAKKKPAGWP